MSLARERSIEPAALAEAVAVLRPRLLSPEVAYGERLKALGSLSDALLADGGAALGSPGDIGLPALTGFLRSENLEQLIAREVAHPAALEEFASTGGRKHLRLLPRGVVCHWIAGNVPLLGVFSWALSALVGNLNVVRLSGTQADHLSPLLECLKELSDAGRAIAEETLVVRFEREDEEMHAAMSRLADLRVIWGGREAVEAVRDLPRSWDAEDLILGPRISLAVVDPALAGDRVLSRLVTDIVYFDQQACSSPQQVYVKGAPGEADFEAFVSRFAQEFERQACAIPRHPLDFGETYQIQRDRVRVLFADGSLEHDDGTQWTVAVLSRPRLDIHGVNRFIQLVPFSRLEELHSFIPENAQTVVTLLGPDETAQLAEDAARRGVCRFPRPGEGNSFELPWDGIPFISRLCRWVVRTEPRQRPDEGSA